jgi:hypothetical protein
MPFNNDLKLSGLNAKYMTLTDWSNKQDSKICCLNAIVSL